MKGILICALLGVVLFTVPGLLNMVTIMAGALAVFVVWAVVEEIYAERQYNKARKSADTPEGEE